MYIRIYGSLKIKTNKIKFYVHKNNNVRGIGVV